MTKSRLKGTLVPSTAPATPAPATPAPATPAPATPAPATPIPSTKALAIASIEAEIEEKILAFQVLENGLQALEEELDGLKEGFPKQFQAVSDRLGIELEAPEKESEFKFPNLPELGQTAILAALIGLVLVGILWTWWSNPSQGSLPAATTVAEVEGNLTGFEPLETATPESVEMIIIPTPSVVAEATAVVEETSVPTEVPATAVPPTAVPAPEFWDSNAIGVFQIMEFGGVCSGDKVAGIEGPVTIPFPPNYGSVEVTWGRCVVNGGTAEQIAAEDAAAWGKNFVVRNAP